MVGFKPNLSKTLNGQKGWKISKKVNKDYLRTTAATFGEYIDIK